MNKEPFMLFSFFLIAILLLLIVFAKVQVKKIAILEAVDRSGTVSYAHKLMLQNNLA